jgi:hypothetical protein
MRRSRVPCHLALSLLAACGARPDDVASDREALIDGTITDARPEIGRLGLYCAATLIAPDWVLTTPSCVNYSTHLPAGYSFSIDGDAGSPHGVDRVHIFGAYGPAVDNASGTVEYLPDGQGTNDVAILHLTSAVPHNTARPGVIANHWPANNDLVTVFGYSSEYGARYKEFMTFQYPAPNVLFTETDGPAVYGLYADPGTVWGLSTGDFTQDGLNPFYEVYGEAYWFRDAIREVMEGGAPIETDVDYPGMDYATVAAASAVGCQLACAEDLRCHSFTFAGAGCTLRSAVPNWCSSPGATSGSNLQVLAGTNLANGDYKEVDVGTQAPEACLALCAAEPAICAAYTYLPPSGPTRRSVG